MTSHFQSYGARAKKYANPTARRLLETMERKKSNLAVSVDVTKSKDFLAIVDAVGPFTCLIKTHIDIIEDFEPGLIEQLQNLSEKHDFLIFEDRKFADIGNTVRLQYECGIYKISSWSHITNAHTLPGPSIIDGLASVGLSLGRGLLLLTEMSSKGTLATGPYVDASVRMARSHRDFVIGFIAQKRMEGVGLQDPIDEDFLILTPGVGLDSTGDSRGQLYRTPRQVIVESGCDVIIVGRGIYGSDPSQTAKIAGEAERYMLEGWKCYLERISLPATS